MSDEPNYLLVRVAGKHLLIGEQSIEQGQRVEIPYGRGALRGYVVYDECRLCFKLVVPGTYWVPLKSGEVARIVV